MVATKRLYQGRIKIEQNEKGYRFSTDSLILAHHIPLEDHGYGVDLGTGCGIIPILLAKAFPSASFAGIELQKELAVLAERNVHLNGMSDRISIIHGDIKKIEEYLDAGTADVVFSNPPYRTVEAGRISPNKERAFARHELGVSLPEVLSAAGRLLKAAGRVCLIYPAPRCVDLVTGMRAFALEPKKIRFVHSRKQAQAELVYVEGVKGGNPGIEVVPPLYVHNADGSFTEEVKKILG